MEPQNADTSSTTFVTNTGNPPAPGTSWSIPTSASLTGVPATFNTGSTFSAQDIERARQEEKDKLYGRISKADERVAAMEAEMTRWKTEAEQREAERAAKQAAKQAAREAKAAERESRKTAQAEAEMSARTLLETRTREWDERFQTLEARQAAEKAALEKESQFNALRAYIQQRVNQEAGSIAPQLIDLVSGDSPEEVDQSIELMKAKTREIVQSVASGQAQNRAQLRGTAPTGFTANGPMDAENNNRTLSAQEIQQMPMREFARYRDQLLGAASKSGSRGLFD